MNETPRSIGAIDVIPFLHPQGCRTYLVVDKASKDALAIDVHLDVVQNVADRIKTIGAKLKYVVDTHTHADHPSGSRDLASLCNGTRVAHEKAQHAGVTLHPKDGDTLGLGGSVVTVRHAPGHTPDHMVLMADGVLFSGDSVFIGGVARTDFLGGDAGQLYDSIHGLVDRLADATVLFPGHDYQGRVESTLGKERKENPWLAIKDRAEFAQKLAANPPPKPANMDDLLRLNRDSIEIPATVTAAEASQWVKAGGAGSVIDVRTGAEYQGEHIPGSRIIPMDQIEARADEVRAVPAPRLLLCQSGARAAMVRKSLVKLNVGGLSVIEGGISGYSRAGGETVKGKGLISLERQVRIAAGALVLTGVIGGTFVSPGFYGLAAFVGAGLMFAGITDWCGMGILLSKMPWNQASLPGTASAGGSCAASAPSACAASLPASSTGSGK